MKVLFVPDLINLLTPIFILMRSNIGFVGDLYHIQYQSRFVTLFYNTIGANLLKFDSHQLKNGLKHELVASLRKVW